MSNSVTAISTWQIESSIERLGSLKKMLELQNPKLLEVYEQSIDDAITALQIAYGF